LAKKRKDYPRLVRHARQLMLDEELTENAAADRVATDLVTSEGIGNPESVARNLRRLLKRSRREESVPLPGSLIVLPEIEKWIFNAGTSLGPEEILSRKGLGILQEQGEAIRRFCKARLPLLNGVWGTMERKSTLRRVGPGTQEPVVPPGS